MTWEQVSQKLNILTTRGKRTAGGYGLGEGYLGVWREFFIILRLSVADALT